MEPAPMQVDVLALERRAVPRAAAGDRQQADQGLAPSLPAAAGFSSRAAVINAAISLVGEDERREPLAVPGSRSLRWDLAGGVDRGQMPGEPACDGRAVGARMRVYVDREP